MTIASNLARVSYAGNGTTTQFAYPFVFFVPGDLNVRLFDTVANAWVAPKPVLNGSGTYDYTVTGSFDTLTGEYDAGATVAFNTAPPATYKVVISLALGFSQPLSLQDNSKFPALVVNAELDRLTLLTQQLNRTAGAPYGIAAPLSDEPSINLELPPAAIRANAGGGSYLGFDGNGNVTTYGIPVTQTIPMQGLRGKSVTGASYTYGPADYGCLVMRSNGGAAMADVMPGAAAGGGLTASTTIAIRNDDAAGWLQLSAAPIGGAVTTALEGQVPLRSDGNSLAFFEPGRGALFAYDTVPALPVWRDVSRALANLLIADTPAIQLVAGLQGATPSPVGGSAGSPVDYWPSRLTQLEAVAGAYAIDLQNTLYRIWGTSVAIGTATSWPGRAGAATYPRDTLPLVNYADQVQRLIAGAGQVIERAATNILPNPGATGATVGAGVGHLPTSWRFVLNADAATTLTVVTAAYPDGTYNANRIRLTIARAGSAVANSTMGIGMGAAPGIQIPVIALGGVNFSAIAQVVSSSGAFASAQMIVKETQSDGVTFVGTTLGDLLGTVFGSTKKRVWRAVPHNNYADCQLQLALSNATADFSVTLDILVTQLEDSASLTDYTTFTLGTHNAEQLSLLIPTNGGMGASDVFLQSLTRGSWRRAQAAGNVSVNALAGEGFGVLARARAYPAGSLDWLRATQTAAVLEPAGAPAANPSLWSEQQNSLAALQLGLLNGGAAYWQANNADAAGVAPWACNVALTKQTSAIVRLELRKDDHWSGDAGGLVERTQLCAFNPLTSAAPTWPLYQNNWFGFSFYIEPGAPLTGFALANNDWFRFLTLASGAGNKDALRLELTPAQNPGGDGEHLALQLASSGLTVAGVQDPAIYYPFTTNTAIARGVWHDCVLRVYLDEHANGSGVVNLYLDGVLLFAYAGPIGYAGDPPHLVAQLLRPNPNHSPHETLAIQFANFDCRTDGSALALRAGGAFPDVA